VRLLEQALAVVAPPFCWACGGGARLGEPLCRRCRGRLDWLDPEPVSLAGVDVWAPVAYEGPARALVHGLKFRGAPGLARPLGAQIVANAPRGLLGGRVALVPVPLHPRRARARGFNQAERLAAAVALRTGAAVVDCLRRGGPGRARQMGRGRSERLAGVDGRIALKPGMRAPARVILVDDVVTTGATLAACAAALRAAGTGEVAAVAYALTPGR
jgi:ComF family protein